MVHNKDMMLDVVNTMQTSLLDLQLEQVKKSKQTEQFLILIAACLLIGFCVCVLFVVPNERLLLEQKVEALTKLQAEQTLKLQEVMDLKPKTIPWYKKVVHVFFK